MFTLECFVYMTIRHKHLKLDQDKLDKARQVLGLATEQETVESALDMVLAEQEIVEAHQGARGVRGFTDPFGAEGSRRTARPGKRR